MKKLFVLFLLMIPALALAQTATSTVVDPTMVVEELSGVVALMTKAFSDGNWRLGFGLLLTLSIALFKLLGLNKLISKKNNKWVAGGLALVGSLAVGLMSGIGWVAIVSTAVSVGATAVGGWEIVLEPLMKWLKGKWPKVFGWLPTELPTEGQSP